MKANLQNRLLRLILLLTALSAISLCGQDSGASPSLGDLARQTRAAHTDISGQANQAQALVDEMQQEQEASESAPTGYTNLDAGDYRLFVPNPFSLEGRESGGPVVAGSQIGVTNTEVLAAAPVPIPANSSAVDISNLVSQIAALHGDHPSCSPTKIGEHKAFRCYWNGTPVVLGQQVFGTMIVIVGSSSLIPVMCVSPDEFQCVGITRTGVFDCNHRLMSADQTRKALADQNLRFRDERTTAQVCEQIIYPSIALKEDIVVHPATIAAGTTPHSVAMSGSAAPPVIGGSATAPATSLADLARKSRETGTSARAKLDDEGSLAPAGFQRFSLQYCQNPQHCSEATVFVPEKVEVVSRVNGQHVFKASLSGDPVMLYAGPADVNAPYRSMTDPDYMRIRDVANSNHWSQEKTDGVSTQELTVAGKPALLTRFRYQRTPRIWWIGERALIEMGGMQFLVGCAAPEQRFADAELLCTTMVNSLQLP